MSSLITSNAISKPTNPYHSSSMLTDLYQVTMCYAYWKQNRHNSIATFEVTFRKNPFKNGEYTVFCGVQDVIKFMYHFKFTKDEIEYLKSLHTLKHCEVEFFEYLSALTCVDNNVEVNGCREGTIVFPRTPLISITGPLGLVQLLETPILNMVNYPSLVATNASRMVLASKASFDYNSNKVTINPTPRLLEFGLRRAQGPDGAMSASKYSLIGGFDATSNVLAGMMYGADVSGTHAHSFVMSFRDLSQVSNITLAPACGDGAPIELLPKVLHYRNIMEYSNTNDGELAAFISYSSAFPASFLGLVDTYNTLLSGIKNFILVSLVLDDLGYKPIGIRLDSGDLSSLSNACHKLFQNISRTYPERKFLHNLTIAASNDLDEEELHALKQKTHSISAFGIGTNLVTCSNQPALGCVYKLVSIQNEPCMKISEQMEKVTIPFAKRIFRLYGKDNYPLLDLILKEEEAVPQVGTEIICRHPFQEQVRVSITPTRVESLHSKALHSSGFDPDCHFSSSIEESRLFVLKQLQTFRCNIFKYPLPEKYLVTVSCHLYKELHELWHDMTPLLEMY